MDPSSPHYRNHSPSPHVQNPPLHPPREFPLHSPHLSSDPSSVPSQPFFPHCLAPYSSPLTLGRKRPWPACTASLPITRIRSLSCQQRHSRTICRGPSTSLCRDLCCAEGGLHFRSGPALTSVKSVRDGGRAPTNMDAGWPENAPGRLGHAKASVLAGGVENGLTDGTLEEIRKYTSEIHQQWPAGAYVSRARN